jgi:hypothetical protein
MLNPIRSHTPLMRALMLGAALPAMLLASAGHTAQAAATAAPHFVAPPGTDAQVLDYWTPDRLKAAKPMRLHIAGAPRHGQLAHVSKSARQTFQGAFPTEPYDQDQATQLFDTTQDQSQTRPGVKAPLLGSGGVPFTTNRVYPLGDKQLPKVFPYATFGHLFFTINGSPFVCSASVIRANVIATAGHCVNDGNGNYYANWLFVPAENNGAAPYGKWTWADADTTSSWYFGGGAVPNDQDDAVIVLNENKVRGQYHRIGDLVGYLGYEFNAPLPTAITQIGYPCNLDNCADPVAAYSQDTAGPTNNFQWGTASFGGASGGPEIQDFGQAPSGVPSETLGGNIVVSSTSYTYTDSGVDIDGGSVFYAPGQNGEYTFGDLINWACSFSNAC